MTISRASGTLTFPSAFMLIAAQNPCKYGWYLARTLTDLGRAERIATAHLAEALQYRLRRAEG